MVAALLMLALAAFGSQDVEALERELKSSDDRARRKAVQELAQVASEEAWELVVGALRDPRPMVADEAQIQLGRIQGEDGLKLALGKHGLGSRDELVRLRVAEALGRMQGTFEFDVFNQALKDKDPRVRRALLWSMERIGARKGFDDGWLAKEKTFALHGSDKQPDVRAAAAMATGAMVLDNEPEFVDLVSMDRSPECGAAQMLLARGLGGSRAVGFGRKGARDADRGVRAAAAELLAGVGDRSAAMELAAMLERETNLRLRWRLVALLQELSGKRHRLDARPWRDWAAALPTDWTGERAAADSALDHGEVSAAFAGLPILSERVVFLIDLSGSVWEERPDERTGGRTRKALIDVELRKALEALDEQARFNLIPYTARPIPWKKQLVPAKPANVAKALKWFEGRKDSGTGNFWDAALFAMEDPEVDSIIVLTDGAPSGGHRWNLELMKDLFREHNRFRRLALDAIIADGSGFLVEQWRQMCRESGGQVALVSFD